jgi:hypothetical protein
VVISKSVAYRQFPAPHLRTNGFVIARDTWLSLCSRRLANKTAAYRLESGRCGMAARLQARGLRVLVAGRDGRTFDPPEWPTSRTYWQGDQENLLIADNRTDQYQRADFDARQALSRYAWGSEASPKMPATSHST